MTVADLIEKLRELPPDMPVYTWSDRKQDYVPVLIQSWGTTIDYHEGFFKEKVLVI